jgi:ABC-type dipeptide/oligopeptide/nickel transport system permease subunit
MLATGTSSQTAWKKLRKNYSAMLGIIIISISIAIAIASYYLSPDASPNANRMILEMGGRPPGTTQLFLKLSKNTSIATKAYPWWHKLLYGMADKYTYLPINSYTTTKDSITVDKYIDEGLSTSQSFAFNADIAYFAVQQKFLLGTDKYGRDILSRLLLGTRVSLSVGCIAVLISLTIGILLGALAGYFKGTTDAVIMWLINVIWSIPTLLLVFAITLLLGKGFWQVFIAVGLTMWVNVARMVRGQVLMVRELEYIEAAKALGYTPTRIIFKHILPNIIGPILVVAASNFASAIVVEAGLSFLGVGVQAPQPSWGLMIKENYNFIITHNPALALAPGFAIMLLVLAFNLLGNGLRDALNVRG